MMRRRRRRRKRRRRMPWKRSGDVRVMGCMRVGAYREKYRKAEPRGEGAKRKVSK
jgi:hypothetical protein